MSWAEAFGKMGFDVDSAATGEEAADLINRSRYDALIVGSRVEEDERNRIATAFKKNNPEGRIVFLYYGSIRKAEIADAVLNVLNDPEDLAVAVRQQVRRARAG